MTSPTIALLCPPSFDRAGAAGQLRHAGAVILDIDVEDQLPSRALGLLIPGHGTFGLNGEPVPASLVEAVRADLPVLGIDWGMQALNAAYGGRPPRSVASHAPAPDGSPSRHRVFLTLGGKVAAVIGGAGVVGIPSAHGTGIFESDRGRGLMTSAYSLDDGLVEAIEAPGTHWIIGVQWPAYLMEALPAGFSNLVPALVEQATLRAGGSSLGI